MGTLTDWVRAASDKLGNGDDDSHMYRMLLLFQLHSIPIVTATLTLCRMRAWERADRQRTDELIERRASRGGGQEATKKSTVARQLWRSRWTERDHDTTVSGSWHSARRRITHLTCRYLLARPIDRAAVIPRIYVLVVGTLSIAPGEWIALLCRIHWTVSFIFECDMMDIDSQRSGQLAATAAAAHEWGSGMRWWWWDD